MFPLLEFDICRIFWKVLFLVVLIPFLGVSQLTRNQDKAQIVAVQKVSSCPVTKEKWIEDRKAKNCSSKNETLEYHCLLNHWRNQSFVLCGEDRDIVGFFCPEYDERRGRIQENYDVKCIELNPPCPIKYNSSDVYKYTACINTNINETSNTPKKENIERNIWFITLAVLITVTVMIFILFFLIRLKRGYKCCIFKEPRVCSLSPNRSPLRFKSKYSWSSIGETGCCKSNDSSSTIADTICFEETEKLPFFLIDAFQLPTSDVSFAEELLQLVYSLDIILSRKVTPKITFETTADSHEPGKIYFAEVMVTCEKNQLIVKPKDSNDWEKFLQDNQEHQVKVILIHSKSVRVIEAKLNVYKEYKTVIDSGKIYLQHVYDDFEEISKLSEHNKMTWLGSVVKILRNNLDRLNSILVKDMDRILTEENILKPCQKAFGLSDYFYLPEIATLGENKQLILGTLERTLEVLGSTINFEISQHFESENKMKNLPKLEFKIHRILINVFVSNLSWSESKNVNVNSKEIREKVARDISSKKSDILKDILSAIEATDDDLKNVSLKLDQVIRDLKLIDQIEVVKTWEKREDLQCLRDHPSVLKFIVGQKYNKPAIKVFLSHDDTSAIEKEIPKGTCFEIVNVAEKSKEIFEAEKEIMDYSSFLDENHVRTKLGEIIKKHAEKLYAKHSSIVGLDAGCMDFEGKRQPCIIIYSLDKDLIPYGEDPLPKTLDGWHCDVREDIVMFGICFDCRQITYPNPGCCIGLPSNGIGSAGFLAKSKGSKSPVTGFLTAAHVAAKNWTDLYDFNELLSNLVTGGDDIVHPLLPGCTDYKIIGKVKESFCGNWGEEGVGMDAAFVQNFEPRNEEYSELQIADETILQFNVSKVMKRGGSTGETEGLLTGNTFSVCVDKDFNIGGFYYFAKCFSIKSIFRPFFERGDSGSGVFLMENGTPTKPLGIAFAKLLIRHNTAVCRIDKIAEAFGLSVYQHEEPMEI